MKKTLFATTALAAGLVVTPLLAAEAPTATVRGYVNAGMYYGDLAGTSGDFGVEHDAKEWQSCTTVADCADPKKNSWTKSEVFTVVTPKVEKMTNGVKDYLNTRSWPNDTVNKLLAWKEDNQATGEDTAYYFLENNPDIWTKWVTPEAAEKIKASL